MRSWNLGTVQYLLPFSLFLAGKDEKWPRRDIKGRIIVETIVRTFCLVLFLKNTIDINFPELLFFVE